MIRPRNGSWPGPDSGHSRPLTWTCPTTRSPASAPGRMAWGDGFEIDAVTTCRFAAAGVSITEVPSVEKPRMFGEPSLHPFSDGLRVLRTLLTERRPAHSTQ